VLRQNSVLNYTHGLHNTPFEYRAATCVRARKLHTYLEMHRLIHFSSVQCKKYSWGMAVPQLVEALCYKPEGRRFESRECHWNFSLTCSFQPHYVPGVGSASNRNKYQEYFLVRRAVNLTFMCLLSWNLGAWPPCFTFIQHWHSTLCVCKYTTVHYDINTNRQSEDNSLRQ
jgi:hypothetical protein